jgi:hypothetical protein
VAHILQQDQAVGRVFDDNLVELGGRGKPAHHAHRNLESLLGIRWRLAELPGGNLHVLLYQRVHHVGRGEIAGGQPHRVKPHAHGVLALAEDHHIAHAGHALDRVLHIDVEIVGDEFGRVAAVLGVESGAKDKVGVRLVDSDAGRVHRRGHPSLGAGYAILHIHGRDVQVIAGAEGRGNRAGSAIGAR